MDAAARLFRLGKVKRLLLSGDHRQSDYNEPEAMRRTLLARHVPARALSVDNAGVRTLDSVLRARQVFGLTHFTIISQRDHDERALLDRQALSHRCDCLCRGRCAFPRGRAHAPS